MPWARARKLPVTEALLNEKGELCNTNEMVFDTLHKTFNATDDRPIDLRRFEESLPPIPKREWLPFSSQEVTNALTKCVKNTAPGPNNVTWRTLKKIMRGTYDFENSIKAIANACFEVGYWPSHFKKLVSIIIPKLNKPVYDKAKSFRPIVLLNTIGKLIEKMIVIHLQFEGVGSGVVHPCQTGGVIQRLVQDTTVALSHHIRTG
jgi:hypothetical protein